ncbi:MAG: RES family NAD+ phosphorylase [Actinomycetota bacterium]|nr:RES family NAD+ phosphorylase [Actinomycetota bacterium]MDQ6948644.1 RES family NAD+ phosphorylase [Actinomycetota bacterium]
MRWFRHVDRRCAFLWETAAQPEARWHGAGEGPAQYLADTPAGAWAELIRHEAITDPDDLVDVIRALWAIEIPDDEPANAAVPELRAAMLAGGTDSYQPCQHEARRLRANGSAAIEAPSAALVSGAAAPERTDGGLRPGTPADGRVLVLFGPRPHLDGWRVVVGGHLDPDLLAVTRPL